MKEVKNIAASVRARLLGLAKAGNRPFNEILQYYAMERFLYRLSLSPHAGKFILKGALMLRVWGASEFRPTMDIDLLGRTSNAISDIIDQFRAILAVKTQDDGLFFDPQSLDAEAIAEDAEYAGLRVRFLGKLDSARVHMQIDIGFSDVVFPGAREEELPTMVDFPPAKLLCYTRESAIAEKFEAMVKLGRLNSRMKDFYDIWTLSRRFAFDAAVLSEAIRRTFERRGTRLPEDLSSFDEAFIAEKQVQWAAFRKRLKQEYLPGEFRDIVAPLKGFLEPTITTQEQGREKLKHWKAPGPWLLV